MLQPFPPRRPKRGPPSRVEKQLDAIARLPKPSRSSFPKCSTTCWGRTQAREHRDRRMPPPDLLSAAHTRHVSANTTSGAGDHPAAPRRSLLAALKEHERRAETAAARYFRQKMFQARPAHFAGQSRHKPPTEICFSSTSTPLPRSQHPQIARIFPFQLPTVTPCWVCAPAFHIAWSDPATGWGSFNDQDVERRRTALLHLTEGAISLPAPS